jgi:hypothetical protein
MKWHVRAAVRPQSYLKRISNMRKIVLGMCAAAALLTSANADYLMTLKNEQNTFNACVTEYS